MPAPPSSEQKSLVGYTIGKCKLLRICGRGAMGTVYKGIHSGLDIDVAVKILPPHLANNSNLVERFLREAKLAAKLNHANTVRVYDVGEESGYNYLVMEFIEGADALELVKRHGKQSANVVADIGAGAARALDQAHGSEVVHRDIKPANLMLPSTGGVKVADFGLARALASDSGLTMTGAIMGTPDYMAPEQAQGESVGPLADIYSLGATLYHLFVGRPPFAGSSPMAVALQHVTNRIVVPEELVVDEAARDLTRMIHEMTQKDPRQRPTDLAVIARRLQEIARGKKATQKLLSEGATLYATAGFTLDAETINKQKSEEARSQMEDKGRVQSPHLNKLRAAAEKARANPSAPAAPREPSPDMAELTGDMVREARAKARRSSGQIRALGADGGKKTRRTSSPAMSPHREQRPTNSSSSRRNRIVQNPELDDQAWQAYAAKSFPTFEQSSIIDGSAREQASSDRQSAIRQASELGSGSSSGHDFSKPQVVHQGGSAVRRKRSSNGVSLVIALGIIAAVAVGVWFFFLRDSSGANNSGDDPTVALLSADKFQAHTPGVSVTVVAPQRGAGTFYSGTDDGTIIRWVPGTRTTHETVNLGKGSINAVALRVDGKRLAVGTASGEVLLLEPNNLTVVRAGPVKVDAAVTAIAMLGVADMVVGDSKGRLTYAGATTKVQVDPGGAPIAGIIYRDGEIWSAAGKTVARYQIKAGELKQLSRNDSLPGVVTKLVGGRFGVFALMGGKIVELGTTGPGKHSFTPVKPVLGVTPNGSHLFTIGENGVTVLNPRTLEVVSATALPEGGTVTSAGASDESGVFYFGTASGELFVCTLRSK